MATPGAAAKRQRVEADDDTKPMEDNGPPTSAQGPSVQELMPAYYARLFPHQHMYRWLVYGNDGKHPQADQGFFQRREFCFTMEGDIFVRYQSFKDGSDMAEAIRRKCPSKIDIGPVYTYNPQNRLSLGAQFHPVERELVFDIDLTDYDDVRTCGKEGHICPKCWPFMAVAVKVIDRGLREDYGFQSILWVYSGRRGVHCWVCDPSARKLTDEARTAIVNYFSVYKGHEGDKVKVALGGNPQALHPAVDAAAGVLEEAWEEHILPRQELLESEEGQSKLLKYIPDEDLVKAIRKAWSSSKPSRVASSDVNVQRWRVLKEMVETKHQEQAAVKNYQASRALARCLPEIIFAHTYPRLDMEVSKKMNHLLKAPFCVHPKTGKVCVPIDPAQADSFDPDEVPTVQSLLAQLPADAPKGAEQWQSTDLAASVMLFQTQFLDECQKGNRVELSSRSKAAAVVANAVLAY